MKGRFNMITLYSTHCPKCKVLEKKLDALGKDYEIIDDTSKVVEFAQEHGYNSAPILVTEENEILDFVKANKYLST